MITIYKFKVVNFLFVTIVNNRILNISMYGSLVEFRLLQLFIVTYLLPFYVITFWNWLRKEIFCTYF